MPRGMEIRECHTFPEAEKITSAGGVAVIENGRDGIDPRYCHIFVRDKGLGKSLAASLGGQVVNPNEAGTCVLIDDITANDAIAKLQEHFAGDDQSS